MLEFQQVIVEGLGRSFRSQFWSLRHRGKQTALCRHPREQSKMRSGGVVRERGTHG